MCYDDKGQVPLEVIIKDKQSKDTFDHEVLSFLWYRAVTKFNPSLFVPPDYCPTVKSLPIRKLQTPKSSALLIKKINSLVR